MLIVPASSIVALSLAADVPFYGDMDGSGTVTIAPEQARRHIILAQNW